MSFSTEATTGQGSAQQRIAVASCVVLGLALTVGVLLLAMLSVVHVREPACGPGPKDWSGLVAALSGLWVFTLAAAAGAIWTHWRALTRATTFWVLCALISTLVSSTLMALEVFALFVTTCVFY